MPTFETELQQTKEYVPNVVIRVGGKYFAIRQPDSGLSIPYPYANALAGLNLSPATIDPRQVNTTISGTSFQLVDLGGIVSMLHKDGAQDLLKTDVDVWLGRSEVGMSFADYYQLPTTLLTKTSKQGDVYSFTASDVTEQLNRPTFQAFTQLNGEIVEGTSIIRAVDTSDFPATGFFKLESELVSYASKDASYFYGCGRAGGASSEAAPHDNGVQVQLAWYDSANPLDILLRLLISNGGGGTYDYYPDGLGIDEARVDVAGIEALRNKYFSTYTFQLVLSNITNTLQFVENEILMPLRLRFRANGNLISLVQLDAAQLIDDSRVIDHDTLTDAPQLEASQALVQNQIQVSWNWNDGTQQFDTVEIFQDDDSVALYGPPASPARFEFKGIRDDAIISDFATAYLRRFAFPTPEISASTQIDKGLLTVGDTVALETSLLANSDGERQFADTLEVISRAISWENGEVAQKLAYNSLTGYRMGFIAPSSNVASIASQSEVTVETGHGALWAVGWKVRLWDRVGLAYTSDDTNEILSIDGDVITFASAFSTTLSTNHTLSFPVYDEATAQQKRYGYVSPTDADFSRREKAYSIVP